MSKFWYLVWYGVKKRVKKKSFVISNIIVGLIIILITCLPTIISSFGGEFDDKMEVYVFDNSEKTKNYNYFQTYINENSELFEKYIFTVKNEEFNVEKKDEYGQHSQFIIIFSGKENNFSTTIYCNELDISKKLNFNNAINYVKNEILLETANEETKEIIESYLEKPQIDYIAFDNDKSSSSVSVLGLFCEIFIVPLFIFLIIMVTFIGTEIIEEKSSRAIEIIITNVTPVQHFGSKILSLLIFLLIQIGCFAVFGGLGFLISIITGSNLSGTQQTSFLSPQIINSISSEFEVDPQIITGFINKLPITLLLIALFSIAGFVLYITIMAVLAAMATNNEDFQQFQSPLMIILLAGFYIALFGVMFDNSNFVKICGYIPIFSPFIVPSLYATGTYGILEVLISLFILILFDFIVIYFGIPLYKVSLLNYSDEKFFKRIKKIILLKRQLKRKQ